MSSPPAQEEEAPLVEQQQPSFPVLLNVYDSSTINRYIRCLGLGFYRTSVQVHGREHMFRARVGHESRMVADNVQEHPGYQGLTIHQAILIGHTQFDQDQVEEELSRLENEYNGNSYNLVTKNSNHFSDSLCQSLTRNPIPSWVNRITFFWRFCSCIVPADDDEDNGGSGSDITIGSTIPEVENI